MNMLIGLVEQGLLPDVLIRRGIRQLLRKCLQEEDHGCVDVNRERQRKLFADLSQGPLTIATDMADRQHYELPPEFYAQVLGPRRKYSCCLYPIGVTGIAAAEETMLKLTCQRAGLEDGMDILELGCGWGSLTLWMAEQYPEARITAISGSIPQRLHIESVCREKGFAHVRVVSADMNTFDTDACFDRVVTVELFEHMRNYAELLRRIAGWLKDDGRLFVQIFCHRELAYLFETEGEEEWMGRYFFTGGIMPSDHLLFYFNRDMLVEEHWRVNGEHYQQTSEDWLHLLDSRRQVVLPILEKFYGEEAEVWFQRWRVFFMACAELFGYNAGNEWFVGQYLLRKAQTLECAEINNPIRGAHHD